MKMRVVVAIELEIDPEMLNCPVNGVAAIAKNYADMALRYGSIGADAAEVLHISEVQPPELNQ